MNDIVLCKTEHNGKSFLTAAYYKDMQLSFLHMEPLHDGNYVPGTICIGKAENRLKNLDSTYVRIGESMYYLSGKTVKPGTELPVRIVKNSIGNKRAAVDTRLTLTGRYCIVSTDPADPAGKEKISYSNKLTKGQKETISGWLCEIETCGYEITIRTNAAFAEKKDVTAELEGLCGQMSEILKRAATRTCFSVLYEPPDPGTGLLMEIRGERPDRIVTDQKALYEAVSRRREAEPWLYGEIAGEQIVLWEDPSVPLAAVYNLRRDTERLFEKKVYLKSGAFLVIEKTEAFVSIDVNSGKCTKGKKPEETYRAVNLEAAAEAVRQIILRNLSGMILIDFINMKDPDHREELLHVMRKELKRDPLRSEAVDLTKLGIMEIVRPRKGFSLFL